MLECYCCGKEIEVAEKITRDDICPHCNKPIRCCQNCEFYSENAHNKCIETAADWVVDKESANFCEYFSLTTKKRKKPKTGKEAQKLFDSLFKN